MTWLRDTFGLDYTNGENWDATGIGATNSTDEPAHRALMADAMRDQGLDPSSDADCQFFVDQQTDEAEARGCDRVTAYGPEEIPFRDKS